MKNSGKRRNFAIAEDDYYDNREVRTLPSRKKMYNNREEKYFAIAEEYMTIEKEFAIAER